MDVSTYPSGWTISGQAKATRKAAGDKSPAGTNDHAVGRGIVFSKVLATEQLNLSGRA